VIFSAEPAFAAAFSFLILGETLSEAQWVGAGLMLAGMVLAVLAPRRRAAPVDPRESGG
jgi:drug/metabolite transporter (DMT)-like permease